MVYIAHLKPQPAICANIDKKYRVSYNYYVKHFEWDEQKNATFKIERGICFEDVQTAIEEGELLDDIPHPNRLRYKHQNIFVVKIDNYAYLVPYVEDDVKIFLKTILPNRKVTKKYIKGAVL